MLRDPLNSQQCLQWLPIDSLQGEITSEISGYFGRAPLYYCLEEDTIEVKMNRFAANVNVNSANINEQYQGLASLNNTAVKFLPFIRDAEYDALFRYPYIKFFKFTGFIGARVKNLYCAGTVKTNMHPHGASIGWSTLICWDGNKPKFIPIIGGPMTDGDVSFRSDSQLDGNDIGILIDDFISRLIGNLENLVPGIGQFFSSLIWRFEVDTWGGWGLFYVPFSDQYTVPGAILRVPWGLDGGALSIAIGALQNAIGGNGQVAGMMKMKIITEDDDSFGSAITDPISDLGGDILGFAMQVNGATHSESVGTVVAGTISGKFNVQYCKKLVKVVNSSGASKAWTNRVNPGSGYILPDNKSRIGRYFYEDPFDYDKFLVCPNNYQSSDYSPFGAMVAPSNAQDPEAWDSREGAVNRQPLYYEPPRTQAFQSPYQARMGEVHDINALKHIFAESYGAWIWNQDDENSYNNGYKFINSPSLSWSVPSNYCTNASGEEVGYRPYPSGSGYGDNELCLVRPSIWVSGYSVANGNTMRLSFNVKGDTNQLPITGYTIYWGDGEMTSYTGVNLRNRQSLEEPFVVYHTYNFEKIKQNCDDTLSNNPDSHPDKCSALIRGNLADVKIGINISDNWGAEAINYKIIEGRISSQNLNDFVESFDDTPPTIAPMTGQEKCDLNLFSASDGHECIKNEPCCGNNCKWLTNSGLDASGNQCVLDGCQGLNIRKTGAHLLNESNDNCCDSAEDWNNDDACPLREGDSFSIKWLGNQGGNLLTGFHFLSNNSGDWDPDDWVDTPANMSFDGYNTPNSPNCEKTNIFDQDGDLLTNLSYTEDDGRKAQCVFNSLNANRLDARGDWERFKFCSSVTTTQSSDNDYDICDGDQDGYNDIGNNIFASSDINDIGNNGIYYLSVTGMPITNTQISKSPQYNEEQYRGRILSYTHNLLDDSVFGRGYHSTVFGPKSSGDQGKFYNLKNQGPGAVTALPIKLIKEMGSLGTQLKRGDIFSIKTAGTAVSKIKYRFLKVTDNFEQTLIIPGSGTSGSGCGYVDHDGNQHNCSGPRALFQICGIDGDCYNSSGNIYDGLPSYCIPTNP